MKKINKKLLIVIAVVCAFFLVVNILVSVFAKKIIIEQIQENLKVPAKLVSVTVSLSLSVNLNNLEVGDFFKVQRLCVSPKILGFFARKIVLNKITLIKPVINLVQSSTGELNLPKVEQKKEQKVEQKVEAKGKPPEIYIASLRIRDGSFIFTDKKVNPAGYKVIFGNINVDISKVVLPVTSLKTDFKASSDVLDPDNKKIGSMTFSGWLDFIPKDMDGILEIKGLELPYFAPYYGNFISKKKLQSGMLNVKTTFKSKSNNLNILTNFRLSGLTYIKGENADAGFLQVDLTKNALDFFTDTEGNLDFDFNINTELDNPNLTPMEVKKIILKAAAKNLSKQSPEALMKKVNDNVEDIQALGKSLEGLFKVKK